MLVPITLIFVLVSEIVGLLKSKSKTLRAPDELAFASLVHPYLSPETFSNGVPMAGSSSPNLALWPLVTMVVISCPSKILSTGLVLVDLPGGNDANAARTRIGEDYIDQCDHLMIVSTAVRPGDEATSRSK